MICDPPHLVFKCDPSSCDDLLAFGAFGCEFLFEASDAVDVCLVWDDEWFATNLTFANNALETTVVPLFALVLHLEKIIKVVSSRRDLYALGHLLRLINNLKS